MKQVVIVLGALLFLLVIYDRITIDKLNLDLSTARDQINQLSKVNTFERKRKQIHFVKSDAARSKMFSFLYEINKDKKRIKYIPGELLVEDIELGKNDQFLDLLDLLFEQEQLIMIEIPDNKSIKEDLRLAGFSNDYISISKDGEWRIKIKE
jgi:hypothetical protein